MKPSHHFAPIEGLRGYLALWVAIGHGMQTAGYLALPGPLKYLMAGEQAVFVFVILSGFVITNLLLQEPVGYLPYLVRRFFRLFPAFVLACVAGYAVMGLWSEVAQHAVYNQDGTRYTARVLEIARQTRENTAVHALWHVTMLHGLIPDQWLPVSPMTFLPAAWSISLEWQFYLLAPLVLLGTRRPALGAALVLACLVLQVAYQRGWLGTYAVNSHIAGMTGYFAIGIFSRLALPRLQQQPWPALPVALLAVLMVATLSRGEALAAMVWAGFLPFLVWRQQSPRAGRVFDLLTTNPAILLLGTTSYSLYLFHRPLQVSLAAWAQAHGLQGPQMVGVMMLAVACTVPVAWAAYRWVEVPGQRLGKRLAQRLQQKQSPVPRPAAQSADVFHA